MSDWSSITFSTANFITSPSATWTVCSTNQTTLAYRPLGRTITAAFAIENTVITSQASLLKLRMPMNVGAKRLVSVPMTILDNGTFSDGVLEPTTSTGTGTALYLNIARLDGALFSKSTGGLTSLYGEITFELE